MATLPRDSRSAYGGRIREPQTGDCRTKAEGDWQSAGDLLKCGACEPMIAWLRDHLLKHVLPFWTRHAFDAEGGLCTCLNDAGEIDSHDKWLWSQWRAVWVFSRIYNTIEPNPCWLRRAQDIASFCLQHGWQDSEQGWALVLARDGKVMRGYESVYVDGFAIYGLGELYRASGMTEYRNWAVRTADAILAKLTRPFDQLPHFPYPIPAGSKPQGIPMIFSHVISELGNIISEKRYLLAAQHLADDMLAHHHDSGDDYIHEFVSESGGRLEATAGKVIVPGHVIENMWFQLDVLAHSDAVSVRKTEAYRLILRHLELGWDGEFGGLRLAINCDKSEPVAWRFADAKLWWPHTETLIATLRGWRETGKPTFLDWYLKVWRLCLEHYVDWVHGEWRQKLNRDLTPMNDVVALPVKDPFHLPRSLILQIELLEAARTTS